MLAQHRRWVRSIHPAAPGTFTGIQHHFNVSSGETGTIVASALLGSAIGAAIAGRLADRIGRLRVMHIAAALFAISALGSSMPFSVWDLGIWRVFGGIAIGLASLIGPTYIAEVAPASHRGRLASFQQAAIVLGITASQLVNWAIAQGADGKSQNPLGPLDAWQWMLMAAVLPAIGYYVLTSRIPESPHFLVATGRLDQARTVLRDVEGPGIDANARVSEIGHSLRSDEKPRMRELFGGRFGLLPIIWAGIGLAVFQQFVGINVIFYYSSILWQSVGIDQSSSLLISLSTSVVNIVGTVVAILIGTGSEVQLAVEARQQLQADGIPTRVVSMPSVEWFEEQDQAYRDRVLPREVKARVAVEAGIALTWYRFVGEDGRIVSLEHFGASADAKVLYREFGFSAEAVAAAARESLAATTH
ncbi:MFS transporter [Actinacidiphila oryziradicis]|uniref:MFS transporter n=1 Tax=Actinacidiphila oryziradicis TaxID=2571141 RepID=UPI0026AC2AB1